MAGDGKRKREDGGEGGRKMAKGEEEGEYARRLRTIDADISSASTEIESLKREIAGLESQIAALGVETPAEDEQQRVVEQQGGDSTASKTGTEVKKAASDAAPVVKEPIPTTGGSQAPSAAPNQQLSVTAHSATPATEGKRDAAVPQPNGSKPAGVPQLNVAAMPFRPAVSKKNGQEKPPARMVDAAPPKRPAWAGKGMEQPTGLPVPHAPPPRPIPSCRKFWLWGDKSSLGCDGVGCVDNHHLLRDDLSNSNAFVDALEKGFLPLWTMVVYSMLRLKVGKRDFMLCLDRAVFPQGRDGPAADQAEAGKTESKAKLERDAQSAPMGKQMVIGSGQSAQPRTDRGPMPRGPLPYGEAQVNARLLQDFRQLWQNLLLGAQDLSEEAKATWIARTKSGYGPNVLQFTVMLECLEEQKAELKKGKTSGGPAPSK